MSEEETIQISGVAVRLDPAKMESVKEALTAIEGLEIHAEAPEGKIAITLENRNSGQMSDTIQEIEAIDGVAIVNPVYIHDEETV